MQAEGPTFQTQEKRWVVIALKGRKGREPWGPAIEEGKRILRADLGLSRSLGWAGEGALWDMAPVPPSILFSYPLFSPHPYPLFCAPAIFQYSFFLLLLLNARVPICLAIHFLWVEEGPSPPFLPGEYLFSSQTNFPHHELISSFLPLALKVVKLLNLFFISKWQLCLSAVFQCLKFSMCLENDIYNSTWYQNQRRYWTMSC